MIEESNNYLCSRAGWMQDQLKIIDLNGDIVSLSLNIAQRRLHKTIFELQFDKGFPIKAIVCKARREGVSTYTEGLFFGEINIRPNVVATVVSADLDSTNKLFGIIKIFQERMPESLKRETIASNRKEIAYSYPHYSKFVAQTAGKDVLGRGGQTHYLHISELAYWNNAKEQLGGAMQEVPDKESMIIIESTANGASGAFYDIFFNAVQDWRESQNPRNFIPIFLPWYIFPEYQAAIPEDLNFVIGKAHAENFPSEWLEIEDELSKKYNLVNEQLYWRRMAIKNKCQGDLTLFDVEYPYCMRVAFSSSGRNVFVPSVLDKMEKECVQGRSVVFTGGRDGVNIEEVSLHKNCWKIWKYPKPENTYTCGIDAQEGTQADPDDPRSSYDFHSAVIFERESGAVVAEYIGQGNQREFGEQCLRASYFYNDAYTAMELPTALVVLDIYKEAGYDRIYQRQRADEQRIEEDGSQLGWRTTVVTRGKMIETLRSMITEGSLGIYSRNIISEMRTFIYDKNGTPRHASGKHDDSIFALMIAIQVHIRTPIRPESYPFATTKINENKQLPPRLNTLNAVDTWESGGGEDDPWSEYTD